MTQAVRTKAEIRRVSLAKREELHESMRVAFSRLIRNAALELVESLGLRTVHCYLNYRSEVMTLGLVGDLLDRGVTVLVPVVRKSEGREVMEHSILRDPSDLVQGAYGIPEPRVVEFSPIEALDAIIVPIVAYDGFGNRIGYGKGFYDKFLHEASAEVHRIGLAFSVQEAEELPREPHDARLDMVITEQGITFASEA